MLDELKEVAMVLRKLPVVDAAGCTVLGGAGPGPGSDCSLAREGRFPAARAAWRCPPGSLACPLTLELGLAAAAGTALPPHKPPPSPDLDWPRPPPHQVALVGAPNVGKSSLVQQLSSGLPEIRDYPFTTRSIKVGHFYVDGRRHQVWELQRRGPASTAPISGISPGKPLVLTSAPGPWGLISHHLRQPTLLSPSPLPSSPTPQACCRGRTPSATPWSA